MGHARIGNITTRFLKGIVARGSISMTDCADDLEHRKEGVHASEGIYYEREMLLMMLVEIVAWYRRQVGGYQPFDEPVIEPHNASPEQLAALVEWDQAAPLEWNYSGPEQRLVDSIRWRFAPGWRRKYQYHKEMFPILDVYEN